MICSVSRRLLPLHAGGDLPAWLDASVGRHAAGCARCRGELSALRTSLASLRSLGEAGARPEPMRLDDDFWYAIRRDLRSQGLVRGFEDRRAASLTDSLAPGLAPPRRWLAQGGHVPRLAWAALAIVAAAVLFFPRSIGPENGGPGDMAKVDPRSVNTPADPRRPAELAQLDSADDAADAARPVENWIEETRSFAPPEVEFGLERWGAGGADRPDDKETLDF